MKAYGIKTSFLKGRMFKKDHVKGHLKKLGFQNWWEEIAEHVCKKTARQNAKKEIKKEIYNL